MPPKAKIDINSKLSQISQISHVKKKGGAKAKNDPDTESDDDYSTDDKTNDEEEIAEEAGAEVVEEIEEIEDNVNSDDDLEAKEEEDQNEEEEDEEEEDEGGDDGDCLYRFTGKKKKVKDVLADIDVEDDFFEEDQIISSTFVEPSKRMTKNYLTIYERVRILGERAKQLSLGAKALIKGAENMDPKLVARMELEKKIIPLIIIRTLPNGQKEKWKVSELEIIN
jgi:DNA-directed RNA polymerase subunit K/omega